MRTSDNRNYRKCNAYNVANIITEGNTSASNPAEIGGCVGSLSTDASLLNSYNIGEIRENNNNLVKSGGIVGSLQTTATVTNCYYLYQSYTVGIGNRLGNNADVEENLVKTSDYMQSNEFLDLISDGTNFKIDYKKINNGYPILDWQ